MRTCPKHATALRLELEHEPGCPCALGTHFCCCIPKARWSCWKCGPVEVLGAPPQPVTPRPERPAPGAAKTAAAAEPWTDARLWARCPTHALPLQPHFRPSSLRAQWLCPEGCAFTPAAALALARASMERATA